MNPQPVSVMAVRPTDGAPPLTLKDPLSLWNDAKTDGIGLLQTAA